MWSASAELGLRCPLLLYWSLTPHAGQCVMPIACALASTCFLNCLCSLVLVLLTAFLLLSCVCCLLLYCVRWWRVAASARRAPPPSNTTLSVLFSSFFLLFLWKGVCRVVRAQPCEHARNTTRALCVSGFVYCVWCVLLLLQCSVCCPHHTLFTVNNHSAQH